MENSPALKSKDQPAPRKAALKLDTPIQYVKGVGPARAKILAKVGIQAVGDLLYYIPRRYLDRSNIRPIGQLSAVPPDGNRSEEMTVIGKVAAAGILKGRKNRFEVLLKDDTGYLALLWFNWPNYLPKYLKKDMELAVSGQVTYYHGYQMIHPDFEVLSGDGEDELLHTGRIIPLYPSTTDLKAHFLDSRGLRRLVAETLPAVRPVIVDFIPPEVLADVGCPPLDVALNQVHFPDSLADADLARRRLAFDELFFLQLLLQARRATTKKEAKPRTFKPPGDLVWRFLRQLPFQFTAAQKKVFAEITADLTSPAIMNRLLQGDVGSGKTVVAVAAMLGAVENGYQAALMVPTEILAEQHYFTLSRRLEQIGVSTALLTGSTPEKEKKEMHKQLAAGKIQIVFGTHALLQEKVTFRDLALVVIDEQHRFGVLQRAGLRKKGFLPELLVMTATPIPRTLSMTLYGDLDVSVIDEMPPGRQKITTVWRQEPARPDILKFIADQVRKGFQAYIIYPLVEESEKADLKAATESYHELQEKHFSDFNVGLIHGRLKAEERTRVMEAFRKREYQILVSTTVVEVGMDIPNATVMLVEHAERFGLSQLHQLRGRVGRGPARSYCILLSYGALSLEAHQRLEILQQTEDGFKIAEADLKLRGPGEFFGTRQHGLPELKIADLIGDQKLLFDARRWAQRLWQEDPNLAHPKHQRLREQFTRQYHIKLDYLRAG